MVISVVITVNRKLRWVVIYFYKVRPELGNSELFKQNISHNLIVCESGVDLTWPAGSSAFENFVLREIQKYPPNILYRFQSSIITMQSKTISTFSFISLVKKRSHYRVQSKGGNVIKEWKFITVVKELKWAPPWRTSFYLHQSQQTIPVQCNMFEHYRLYQCSVTCSITADYTSVVLRVRSLQTIPV